jgi:hypothetical protein
MLLSLNAPGALARRERYWLITSGTNSPYGIRSWKCPITCASLLGMEIANTSPSAVLNSTT